MLAFPPAAWPLFSSLLDLAFVPAAMIVFTGFILKAKQWCNAVFIPILFLYWIANLLVHLPRYGFELAPRLGPDLGLWLVLLLIIILGGRVIPMFTSNGLGGVKVYSWMAKRASINREDTRGLGISTASCLHL